MESRDYHEGAKALLDLKKKDEVKKERHGADGADGAGDDDLTSNGADSAIDENQDHDDQDQDHESGNNKDDNNVEAAVMRYVGGTLDNRKSNKRKKSFPSNDEINEFQHWNAFLETDQLQHDNDFGTNDLGKDQQSTTIAPPTPQPKSRKKRKQQQQQQQEVSTPQQQQQQQSNINVDPELAQLDDTTEHEQLVRAAILDANQLAQDVNVNIQDYIHQPHDDNDGKYTQLSQTALDNNIIQAAQAAQVAAAAAAAAQEREQPQQQQQQQQQQQEAQTHQNQNQNQQQQTQPQTQSQAQPQPQQQHQNHHHIQQSQHSQIQPQSQQTQPQPQSQQQQVIQQNDSQKNNNKFVGGVGGKQQSIHRITPPSTQSNSQAAALVAEAAQKASNFVQNQSQGKMFSKEEIEAIDKFIIDYCQINNMTRKQICERVWSNERKKDDFWESLHKVLPYRTRASVYKHVRRSYHIFDVRGKWTSEEDLILGRLAQEKDGQWKLIGQEMGRMPEDCRDRWRNYVKCGNNRAQNKWSDEEELKLKQVIGEILTQQTSNPTPIINWTLVSEKMGGTRSRIQCRYKWNKILKRDALSRAQTIDLNDRVWILTKLQELRFLPENEIDWDALASIHPKNFWTGIDFKICFEKMRSSIRDFKKKNILEISSLLLSDLVQDANRNNIELDIPVGLQENLQQLNDQTNNGHHDHGHHGHNNDQHQQQQQQQQQHQQNDVDNTNITNDNVDDKDDVATNLANAAVNVANASAVSVGNSNNEDFTMWR